MPRNTFRFIIKLIKWALAAALTVEALSFLAITISNYLVYGHVWEGSRSAYDAHAIFHQAPTPRPTEFNATSPTAGNNRVIWMFGGSTTRGSDGPPAGTIASRLARRLNQGGSGPRCTVLNFGQNSFNSLLEVQLLQKLLIREKQPPSLIVFQDGANEATYLSQYRSVDGHFGYRRMRSLVAGYRNSPLGVFKAFNAFWYASATRELFDKLHQVALPLADDPGLVRRYVDLLERRYDHLGRLARAHGAGFAAVWQPTAWTEEAGAAPAVTAAEQLMAQQGALKIYGDNMRLVYSSVLTRLKAKPYFVDLHRVLQTRDRPAYRPDGVHLLPAGRELVAQAMAASLRPRLIGQGHAHPAD